MEAKEYILSQLPKTVEHKLHQYDATVNTFVHLMAEKEDWKDLFSVIDDMFIYYTRVINHQQTQLDYLLPKLTVDDMRKLNDLNNAKSAEINDAEPH